MAKTVTERMGEAIAEVVKDLSLTPNVRPRKRPAMLHGEQPPVICVCVADGEEFEPLGSSGERGKFTWLVTRRVALAIGMANGGKTGDNPELRRYRDAIWSAVNALSLATKGLPEANDVKPAGKAIFDATAFVNSTVDWSTIDLAVETLEVRNA